ncbi:hypothetical protein PR048_032159 [Dryococelus australis]|uniref:Uncharacterized protein n=1 Tax=Dryococelus australis TaxID=614101 RepID=A0ABQ9G1E5_9NEOP|nr:hypothetical protein PR048_032159 [Dryococelus australis]
MEGERWGGRGEMGEVVIEWGGGGGRSSGGRGIWRGREGDGESGRRGERDEGERDGERGGGTEGEGGREMGEGEREGEEGGGECARLQTSGQHTCTPEVTSSAGSSAQAVTPLREVPGAQGDVICGRIPRISRPASQHSTVAQPPPMHDRLGNYVSLVKELCCEPDTIRHRSFQPCRTARRVDARFLVERPQTVFLRFYACGSYQLSVGQHFLVAMNQSSVSDCLDDVSTVIIELLREQIKFPEIEREQVNIKQRFVAQICTFFILTPDKEVSHTMHLYGVTVLLGNTRLISGTLMAKHHGDPGYPLESWFLTPILNPPPGSPEALYSRKACFCTELHRKIQLCSKNEVPHRVLHYRPPKTVDIILACAVLQNIAIEVRKYVNIHSSPSTLHLFQSELQAGLPLPENDDDADENAEYVPEGGIGNTLNNGRRLINNRHVLQGDAATSCRPVTTLRNQISCSSAPVKELTPWEHEHLHPSTIWKVCKGVLCTDELTVICASVPTVDSTGVLILVCAGVLVVDHADVLEIRINTLDNDATRLYVHMHARAQLVGRTKPACPSERIAGGTRATGKCWAQKGIHPPAEKAEVEPGRPPAGRIFHYATGCKPSMGVLTI